MATKIFVGSLPSGCKPEELRHLFETFGVVTECDVMNRCGFVHMENADMAETAIKALNSTEFKGETINVEPGRIRGERNQKAGGKIGAPGLIRNRNRGKMGRGGPGQGMEFDGIDENVTKDALQICSAVFEEMNKMLNPNMHQGGPRRGGGGNMPMALPKNFASQLELLSSGGVMDGGNRTNNRNRQRTNRNNSAGSNPGSVGRVAGQSGNPTVPKLGNAVRVPNQVNVARVQNQAKFVGVPNNANAVRGQNQGNAIRAQNQGKVQNHGKPKTAPNQDNVIVQGANRANTGRAQVQGNIGRAPKQGNVGPIRNDPVRPRNNTVPYNRGGNNRGNSAGPQAANINFADDIPIAQNARTFANNLASGSQIDNRWQSNNGNFGHASGGNSGGMNSLMGRNFDEDIPVTNFNNDAPMNNGMGLGNNSNFNSRGSGGMGNQGSLTNHGNFGQSLGNGGGNDRYQNSGSNNDRFQSGGNYGMGNQDRRGFALPERQNFNDNQKFGNQDFRRDNSQQGGNNNQSSNRDFGFGNNSGRQESRNLGGNMGGNDNAMFTRRNNTGNLDGNNMGNSRMRNNDLSDTNNFGGNFGGNNTRGGSNPNSGSGFNRNMGGGNGVNNSNMGGGMSNNLSGVNRNMGGGGGNNNRNNMGGGGGNNNNNRNNMGGGGGNNRNNMGVGGGNGINNRNNMGGGGGNNNTNRNNMTGSLINPLNFQKDFPALSMGSNMNDRNGPRQNNNMMSNRRW